MYFFSILAAIVGGVMNRLLASSVVDRGFEPRSGQTKDNKIGICCFTAKYTGLRRIHTRYLLLFCIVLCCVFVGSVLLTLFSFPCCVVSLCLFVFLLCLVCSMLPGSLDCPFLIVPRFCRLSFI
jgi:Flp pilus assembly protein TadB